MQTMDTKGKGIEYKQMEQTLYKKDREKKDHSLWVISMEVTDKSSLHCPVLHGMEQDNPLQTVSGTKATKYRNPLGN